MKSERKQIQESNLLADKIEAQIVKFKKIFPAVLALVVVVLVALLGYGIYTNIQDTESAKAWTALYFANTDTSDLNKISQDFGGSAAGLWAKQIAGDAYMAKALEKVYIDRSLSDQFYKQAIDEYKVVSEKTSDPFLKARSLYGLAQAAEGMGDREKASALYRKVSLIAAMGPEFVAEATKRANWLDSKAGEEFYTWFQQNRPTAPVLNDKPPTKFQIPGAPDFTLPNFQSNPATIPGEPAPGTSAPNNDLPTIPIPSSTLPGTETPATNAPAATGVPATPSAEPQPTLPEQPSKPNDQPSGATPDAPAPATSTPEPAKPE
jgi:tetratricopeptide (TPR) repeat protein